MVGRLLCEAKLKFSVFVAQPSLEKKGLGKQGMGSVFLMERSSQAVQSGALVSSFCANLDSTTIEAYQDTQTDRTGQTPA